MNRTALGLLAIAALVASLTAHAQLTSVDAGAAAIDSNGLMWANTVAFDVGWSGYPSAAAGGSNQPGSAQAWVNGLNATHYDGYSDWTLATGVGSDAPNTTTNQLGELFYNDCGFSAGASSIGNRCPGFSALNTTLSTGMIYLASSPYADNSPDASADQGNFLFWIYRDFENSQGLWTSDTVFSDPFHGGGVGPFTGTGDALAVRQINQAPEIDPASAASAFTLLIGFLLVIRGRRERILF